jgi:AcrR family transcriptional regulator
MAATHSLHRDVRDQILDEATRLFAARGVDGTSVQEVAEAVGIRRPSLLYHYPSKEALRTAVFERLLAHWNEVLPRLLAAAVSGEERFAAVLSELIKFFVNDPDRARLLLREVLDRPEALRAVMSQHMERWVNIVADYIRRGQREGTIAADVDPEAYVLHVVELVVATVATGASVGSLLPGRRRASRAPSERYLRELTRIAHSALFLPTPVKPTRRPPR